MDANAAIVLKINTAQQLAREGRHAAALEYLSAMPAEEIEASPTLALLFGIAHARSGSHATGVRWVTTALSGSRKRHDRAIEARALNVSGAIALDAGRIEEATTCFRHSLLEAERQLDHATVGRCSNNLGIIANLTGEYGRAVGSYTMALAAFQQSGYRVGIAQVLHNLTITYREQGNLVQALETADRAVAEAGAAGDLALAAQTRMGRAEVRLLAGDPALAQREVERALEAHRKLEDVVGIAEGTRVLANALAAQGEREEAMPLLREVIARADQLGRPLLAAQAGRDLARLLLESDRRDDAVVEARRSRVRFKGLGAEAEVRRLDRLINGPR